MVASRLVALGRLSPAVKKNLLARTNGNLAGLIFTRNHVKLSYRKTPDLNIDPGKPTWILGILFWWWMLWHYFTDFHTLIGHSYPDPSKWTDEELGIPED